MSEIMPLVSVIVPYNSRKDVFYQSIRAYSLSKKISSVEFVIVNDEKGEDTIADIKNVFPELNINYIRINRSDVSWVSPTVSYNLAIKAARGKICLLIRPESFPMEDIFSDVILNLKPKMNIIYGCYSVNKEITADILGRQVTTDSIQQIRNILPLQTSTVLREEGQNAWYQHSMYRPLRYCFCSAYYKEDLVRIGGMNDAYADGIGRIEDDLTFRTEKNGLIVFQNDYIFVLYLNTYKVFEGNYKDAERIKSNNNIFASVKTGQIITSNKYDYIYDRYIGESRKIESDLISPKVLVSPKVLSTPSIKNDSPVREIPKRMFFFYSGASLSWMRYMTMYSFKKMNPNWEVMLYYEDKNVVSFNWGHNTQDFDYEPSKKNYVSLLKDVGVEVKTPVWEEKYRTRVSKLNSIHQSDLYRLIELSTYGGFYCDTDVLFFRSMDDLYNKVNGKYDTLFHEYPSNDNTNQYWLTTGFLASCANNEFFKDAFELGMNQYKNDNYQSCGAHLIYRLLGVEKFTRVEDKLKEIYCDNLFYNMPTDIVYFYDWVQVKKSWDVGVGSRVFPKEAISYHWFGGTGESQKYNRLLNESNFREYYTTFSVIADEIISKPRISIVTSYYNRKTQFVATLKSIQQSSVKDFELIVVDDASDDEHRLELLQNDYPFMKIIRIEKANKWWRNPSAPFNIGIRQAKADIIILQNPECKHSTDILAHAIKNISDENYISYCTYALSPDETNGLAAIDFSKDSSRWYSHSIHRPAYFHFCSAIKKSNMDKINGFDERYAMGFDYDDNELVERIKRLGLNMMITEQSDALVLHQYHGTFVYNQPDAAALCAKNKNLFQNVTLKEKVVRANIKNSYMIAFKGSPARLDNLKVQLMYLFYIIDEYSEIIIVEQDSVSRLDWIKDLEVNFCINHIFIKKDGLFNKGKCHNIGVKSARGNNLIILDCDMLLPRTVYKKSIELLKDYDIVNPYSHVNFLNQKQTVDFMMKVFSANQLSFKKIFSTLLGAGIFMMRKDKFIEMKGYDEEITGWGFDDSILDEKVRALGMKSITLSENDAVHLWHETSSNGGELSYIHKQEAYYSHVAANEYIYRRYKAMDYAAMMAKLNSVKVWGV